MSDPLTTMKNDYFKTDPLTGRRFAGEHILLDLYGVKPNHLKDAAFLELSIRAACRMAGARIIYENYHSFGPGMGVSGVTVLAESHASIHTWPEEGFAAMDVFMCGASDPMIAVNVMINLLEPKTHLHRKEPRGRLLTFRGQ